MALKFVDETEVVSVDMGDGDWVELPARLSFGLVSEFENIQGDVKGAAILISKLIRRWSAKDSSGALLPITIENVRKLDLPSMQKIMEAIVPLTTVEKKSLTPSDEPLKEKEAIPTTLTS